MKFVTQCLSCLIDDVVGAVDMLGVSQKQSTSIMQEVLLYLTTHIADEVPPSYFITDLHRIIKRHLALAMPFAEMRKACLSAGMAIAENVEKESAFKTGLDKFSFLLRWAIASNSLDFRTAGIGYELNAGAIEKSITSYYATGLTVDETKQIYEAVLQAKRIVYIPDNVGELPFDKLLLRAMKINGATITVPMRGGPITSDAVLSDAQEAGLQDVATLILAGPDTLGISFKEMSEELSTALSDADLILAKGQANYYVLSEFGKHYANATIVCLFTAKCNHIWKQFGCNSKASIAAVIQEPQTKQGT